MRDPLLRAKLTPDYDPMCKRLVVSANFYKAVQQPNVDVVTRAIDRVEPEGIVTRDGKLHPLDVLVLATGFDAHAYLRPIALTGPDGITLDDAWRDGPRAYRTVARARLPELLHADGPPQPDRQPVARDRRRDAGRLRDAADPDVPRRPLDSVAPTADATERFNQEMRDAMPATVWVTGCNSWYLGKDGLPELWPWTPERHREMLRDAGARRARASSCIASASRERSILGYVAATVATCRWRQATS